mgnify:FL=1
MAYECHILNLIVSTTGAPLPGLGSLIPGLSILPYGRPYQGFLKKIAISNYSQEKPYNLEILASKYYRHSNSNN